MQTDDLIIHLHNLNAMSYVADRQVKVHLQVVSLSDCRSLSALARGYTPKHVSSFLVGLTSKQRVKCASGTNLLKTTLRTDTLTWLSFVGCLTSQQHESVSQGRICSDNVTCCHTEIVAADQTFYLTQSQYADTGPTSPSADATPPGAWQGSHLSANFEVTGMTRPTTIPTHAGFEPWIFRS